MAYISQFDYYTQESNHGSYQYVSLEDVVNNFMLMYQGNHSLVNNENRYKILFHAKRAIQELNYDAFKEIKILQLDVTDQIRFVLPSDFVNWVRVSMYDNGVLYPLTENIQPLHSDAYLQDSTGKILFDIDGNILKPEFSEIDYDRIIGSKKSIYLNNDSQFNGQLGYQYNGEWYFEYEIGARFGLNTETANSNPTFDIDKKKGVINFSSSMSGKNCLIEYVSDGMEGGDNSAIMVNKLFEEYIYAYIEYSLLDSKLGVQEYIVRRKQRKKSALLRNAKIRMSNIHPGRLLMNLRGQNKWIK